MEIYENRELTLKEFITYGVGSNSQSTIFFNQIIYFNFYLYLITLF